MKNINIVSGISMGLGKELYNALSKKDITFGLTSKQNNPDRNVLYIPYFEVNENIDKIFSDLLVLLKNYKPEKISIYFNSAVYDKEKDSDLDKARILNINYFNQIILYNFLKKKFKNIKFKLIFFSSFEIYNNNSNLIYYKLSKQKYVEEYERLKNDKNLIIKLFIIGGIKTSTYNKNIFNNIFFKN